MSRRIICEECDKKRGRELHPLDAAAGFQKRTVDIIARKPADHAITINGVKQPQMPEMLCDDCGTPMPDGTRVVAVSLWAGCGIMEDWEHEYGKVVEP